jgi:hypothetical protein
VPVHSQVVSPTVKVSPTVGVFGKSIAISFSPDLVNLS